MFKFSRVGEVLMKLISTLAAGGVGALLLFNVLTRVDPNETKQNDRSLPATFINDLAQLPSLIPAATRQLAKENPKAVSYETVVKNMQQALEECNSKELAKADKKIVRQCALVSQMANEMGIDKVSTEKKE